MLVFWLTGFWQLALADTPPPAASPPRGAGAANHESAGDVFPFVLRILDPGKRLEGRVPRVTIDNGRTRRTLVPRDDGSPPDTLPGDGSYALGVADLAGSTFQVTLEAGEGAQAITGKGHVTFSPDNLERNLVILIEESGPVFGTNDNEVDVQQGERSATVTRAGPDGSAPGSHAQGSTGSSARGLFFWAMLFGVGGGLLGVTLFHAHTWWRAGRGLVRAGLGRPMHPLGERLPGTEAPSVWKTTHEAWPDLTATLARRLTARGAVLVVPDPAHREQLEASFAPLAAPIWFPATLRPSPAAVVALVRKLEAFGSLVTLVVEGVESLEEAHPDTPFAALEDLVAASPVPVLVVAAEDSALPETDWPIVHLARNAEGRWTTDGGQVVWPGPTAD